MKLKEILPQPWRFEWINKGETPAIVADNDRIVCLIQTGRLEGPYPKEVIDQIGQMLISNTQQKEMINEMAQFIDFVRGGCPAEDSLAPDFSHEIVDCKNVCGEEGRGKTNPDTNTITTYKCWIDYFKYLSSK